MYSKEILFKCVLCGKGFRIVVMFRNYNRVYSDERFFGCDKCEKCFKIVLEVKLY